MKETKQQVKISSLLWGFLRGSRGLFALSMLSACVSTLADMLSPQIVRAAVDGVLGGEATAFHPLLAPITARLSTESAAAMRTLALALLAVALVKAAALYAFRVFNTRASERLTKTMRDTLFLHIERLPYSWHMQNHTGDIIQRCTSDIDTLKGFLSEQLSAVFRSVLLLALALTFMLGMNVPLTVIALAPVPFIIGYSFLFHRRIGEAFLKCDENEGLLSAMAQENLTGVRVVRAFGRERLERDRFFRQNDYYTGLWMELAKPLSRYWSIGDVISGTQVLLVLAAGSAFCIRGRMLPGELIAFLSYSAMMTWPVRMLGRVIAQMSKAGVSMERISAIMQAEPERESGAGLKPDLNGDICFEHVTFAYEGGGEVLHDVSFTVRAGTTLGILGGTGSGKSTLMLLLDKLYPLPDNDGRITIGGTDIRKIRLEHLRRNIGIVLQEPFLFSRTLRENLAITSPDLDEADLRDAARTACLEETIASFSKGYDTFVGERGVTLSGGQKQRAAIARMLTRQTPIMIFDDSLSAVDTETDAKIRSALEKRFGSATIILISHRITTLSKADKVLVLDHGSVAQFGTPAKLSAQPGLYKQIEEIQSFHGEDPSGDPIYGAKQIPRQIAADGEEAQNRNSCDDCRESEVSE